MQMKEVKIRRVKCRPIWYVRLEVLLCVVIARRDVVRGNLARGQCAVDVIALM